MISALQRSMSDPWRRSFHLASLQADVCVKTGLEFQLSQFSEVTQSRTWRYILSNFRLEIWANFHTFIGKMRVSDLKCRVSWLKTRNLNRSQKEILP